jgi:photosystem II stability/assembly factor-like uncharacterized protein
MPSTLYAATNGSGVYKSTDGGVNWSRINNGLTSVKWVSKLIIDPVTPSVLYLSTQVSVFKSQNGGDNWEEVLKFPSTGDIIFPDDLLLDPRSPSTVYAMGSDRIFKSADGGQNWMEIGGQTGQGQSGQLVGIAVDPVNSTLYAIRNNPGANLFKSTDGGSNWTSITLNLGSLPLFASRKMVIDPASASTLYWATSHGVLKSTDGGSTWVETGFSPSKGFPPVVHTLAINPANTSTIYASTNGAVSSDDSPWIRSIAVEGKRLLVIGDSFDNGAVILLDGEPQKTNNASGNPTRVLVGKKAGKKVKKKPETRIQIRNANGKLSQTVERPVD